MFAMTTEVDKAALLDFVRERGDWVLTTRRQSGGLQMSPVTGAVAEDESLMIATYPQRAKVHNVRSNGDVSICVLSDEFGGAWVQVDGTAHIVDLPDAMAGLVEYYRAAAGEHPDWNEYREAMDRQGKCLIQIEVTGWGPVATGGYPSNLKSMFDTWQPGGGSSEKTDDDGQETGTWPPREADDSPQMFDD
jgi:PPOX class probable F420-dependent enzyme